MSSTQNFIKRANSRFFTFSFIALSCASCHAAPRPQAPSATKATPKTKVPLQSGVNINAVTRNRSASKVALQLAKNGKALVPIVIAPTASKETKAVAAELKKFLGQMSGAEFQIQTGDGSAGLVLGNKSEFPTPALDKALEIVHAFDGKESYAIRTRPGKVLLLGATDLGASHAAYRFLEELGCRWFFPNENWQIVPPTPDLKFGWDITDRPAFLSRRIWYGYGYVTDEKHPRNTKEKPWHAWDDYYEWARRNHMAQSFTANASHAYDAIVADNAAAFAAHPEYFALVKQPDGTKKRQGNQLEVSNPALRKLVCNWAVEYFKRDPGADMVSLEPADGGGYSESEDAKAYGTPGEGAFKLANEVAIALRKAYPGQNKMVGMLAYNWHSDPPSFALEPNVYVQLTTGFNNGLLTLDELLQEWPKKAKNLGFYDYYSVWLWDYDRWPGGAAGKKSNIITRIRQFQQANAVSGAYATSISAESSCNWGVNGRGYYLANQLMWNPDLDPEAVLKDFYDKAFGPASAIMQKYFALQDKPPPITPGVVGVLFRTMNQARLAAKDRPDVMRRLDDLTNYLHFYDLTYRNFRETDAKAKEARALEIREVMYRNRYSYIDHWQAYLTETLHDNGRPEFPRPWLDDDIDIPISPEESQEYIEAGLKFYPELTIPPQTQFSKDLVAVNLGGEPKEFARSAVFQSGIAALAMYSIRGEPIRVTFYAGGMAGGTKLSYELRDDKGKLLASGTPTGTREGTPVEINVPVAKAGLYYLVYTDGSGSMYQFKVPAEQPFAIQLDKFNSTTLYQSTQDLYFYVPKGTKVINYYFARTFESFTGPHLVIAPDGSVAATFLDKDGDYLEVPVPAGMDGKAWHFTSPKGTNQFGLGRFHFFNCPDLLSPSPARMLVPKDVALKDGLPILK